MLDYTPTLDNECEAEQRPGDRLERAVTKMRALTRVDTFAILALSLLTVSLAPGFFMVMNPRHAIVIAGLPLGSWLFARRVWRRDLAAVVGVAVLGVALIGAIRSGPRWTTLVFGSTGSTREMSMLALLAAFGWWATGRELSEHGRDVFPIALTVAAGVNIFVGLIQLAFLPAGGLYGAFSGRMSGLMSNPVYFASTFIGVWGFWLVRAARRAAVIPLVVAGGIAVSIALSGSRGAIAAGVVLSLALVAGRRTRHAAIAAAVSVVSFGIGLGILGLISRSQPGRIGDVDTGVSLRFRVWRAALRAWSNRPFLGWGPDPYQQATSAHITPAEIRADGPPLLWPDPHNVVIYILVSLGAIGLLLIALFVVLGTRGSVKWSLLVAAAAIVSSWMLQPVMSNGWPIAFALFGAAVRPNIREVDSVDATLQRRSVVALISIGLVAGSLFLTWSFRLRSALDDANPDLAEERAGWLIRDPSVASKIAGVHFDVATVGANTPAEADARHLERAEVLIRRAAPRAGDPRYWTFLADVQLVQGDLSGAMATERETIDRYPNIPVTYELLRMTAKLIGDDETERFAIEALCRFGSPSCAEWLDGG